MHLNSTGLSVNGTFVSASDRNLKENIQSISAQDMLVKVIALPMNVWNYEQDSGKVKHIGPTAQDIKHLTCLTWARMTERFPHPTPMESPSRRFRGSIKSSPMR